jgi:hypothetical protein
MSRGRTGERHCKNPDGALIYMKIQETECMMARRLGLALQSTSRDVMSRGRKRAGERKKDESNEELHRKSPDRALVHCTRFGGYPQSNGTCGELG